MSEVRTWLEDLESVTELNGSVRPAEAEDLLRKVIRECPRQELWSLNAETAAALESFFPKRRRVLDALLKQRLAEASDAPPVGGHSDPGSAGPAPAAIQSSAGPGQADPASAPQQAGGQHAGRQQAGMSPDPLKLVIKEIVRLNDAARWAEAEARFRGLLGSLNVSALTAREAELRTALDTFFPRRRNVLGELLDIALNARDEEPLDVVVPSASLPAPAPEVTEAAATAPAPQQVRVTNSHPPELAYARTRFVQALDELSELHIFQWATFYRDVLSEYFEAFLVELCSTERPNALLNMVKAALSHHARDIFRKGYEYSTSHNKATPHLAITKSLAGLQRFLDLPLEFYSARLGEAHREGQAVRLRQLGSAMVFGILNGYTQVKFDMLGSRVLPRFPRTWAHVLPFLMSTDLSEFIGALQPGGFTEGVQDSVLPLVKAIDMFSDHQPDLVPLPALSQYVEETRRIDVSLQLPPTLNSSQLVEIQCFLQQEFVHIHLVEDAAGRGVTAVVAPLQADLRGHLASIERFMDLVIHTDDSAPGRLREVLQHVIDQESSASPDRPITFNFAKVFPLENPFLVKFRHVYRTSVRRLMSSYDRRNGVRLWCSVRRSGKTTACACDLDATSGNTIVIPQSCSSTGVITEGDVFYKEVKQALESGDRLPEDFVRTTVAKCAPDRTTRDYRVVFILDEYEILFGDMRTSLVGREQLRYTVVQPLLDQFVAFARDNLLVFMGQQPNAHHILLDHNQLSPVVEQDSFPLFTHDPLSRSTGEFHQLLQMVLSSHVELDDDFVTRIYSETGGHPFLTVKLLMSFMDWLIETKRPISFLAPVRAKYFDDFARSNLTPVSILRSPNYDFFRGIAANHLSPNARAEDPWLYSVYSALRGIALWSPDSLSLGIDDYVAMLELDRVRTSPHELLGTATRANFLVLQNGQVRPRIPLLARIASAVTAP